MSEVKPIDVDEIKQRAKLAHKYICELAAGNHRWTMCVPAQKDDSDMALQAPLDDVEHLIAEIEKLQSKNSELKKERQSYLDISIMHGKDLAKLTLQRDTLKKALEFYADKDNWVNVNRSNRYFLARTDSDSVQHHTAEGPVDIAGKTARKALQEVEGLE